MQKPSHITPSTLVRFWNTAPPPFDSTLPLSGPKAADPSRTSPIATGNRVWRPSSHVLWIGAGGKIATDGTE